MWKLTTQNNLHYKTHSLRKGEIIFFWALELQTEQFTESSSTDISRARFCISF